MAKDFLNKPGFPLGLRNNNPGNIRPGDNWQGQSGTNAGFIVFRDCSWGIRAIAVDLQTKINNGYNTITKIISRYAPASDGNNTTAYIASVAASTGFSKDAVLTATDATLKKMVRAIMNQELGASYSALLSDQDISEGVAMRSSIYVAPAAAAGISLTAAALFGVALYLVATQHKYNR